MHLDITTELSRLLTKDLRRASKKSKRPLYVPSPNAVNLLGGAYHYEPNTGDIIRALPAKGTYPGRVRADSRSSTIMLYYQGEAYVLTAAELRRLRAGYYG